MRADQLFIFAGAGLSLSAPASLPLFPWIRDEILSQLDLDEYIPCGPRDKLTPQQRIAEGLAPEPFLLALQQSGAGVIPWLERTLGQGRPNAAHVAIAQLAHAGARVWTTNFDTLIEQASPSSSVVTAWPDRPTGHEHLLKPHGTLGGRLIFAADQVLQGLDAHWERQLRRDVRNRVVIFIGYSGRDLDFQPLWDDVLEDATKVLWFDLPDEQERERKVRLLRGVSNSGRLSFPGWMPETRREANPSSDFVRWCRTAGLVTVDDAAVAELLSEATMSYTPIGGSLGFARAATQGILGDLPAARRQYTTLALRGSRPVHAAYQLGLLLVNHGGGRTATALRFAGLMIPAVGRLRSVRTWAQRKHVTILANMGQHTAVIDRTRHIADEDVSTLAILRAGSIRMTGSLDDAADLARSALGRAREERHPVRVANAAFQLCLCLVWSGRLSEAQNHLDDVQRPYAQLSAARWLGWADFIEAMLEIYRGDHAAAVRAVESGAGRFRAEGLLDGVVDMELLRLTALRLAGDRVEWQRRRREFDDLTTESSGAPLRHYTRTHRFTKESLCAEEAEFARVHRCDLDLARSKYEFVARSRYPLHSALGRLGCALVDAETGLDSVEAKAALRIAEQINARFLADRARLLLAAPLDSASRAELVFP